MNNTKRSKIKILGGLLGIVLSLTLLAGTVHAATVTVSCSPPGNPILDNNGSNLAAGAYVQIVKSTDSSASAPSPTDGLPTSPTDTVVNTGTLSAPGTFTKGGNSIPSGQYCYIVAWETWNGTGTPSGRYGISSVSPAMSGISYNFFPATFGTTQTFPVLTITTTSLPNGTQGVAYNQSVSATNGTPPYTWSIISGSLPSGLNLNANTGAITGTPVSTGTSNFTIQVQDSVAATDTQALSITINPGGGALNITTTSLPNGTVGVAYNQTVTATGGTPPYTWSISSGSLPSGLSLNASTGAITGTPATAGLSNFTVQVQDNVAATDTQALSITINDAGSPTITGSSPDDPYVGETITITGSGFGDSPGTITIGGVEATPTSWEDGEIVVAVPDGVAPGSADVVVDGSAPFVITVNSGGLVIDDFEGGCVGDWVATPASGYYAYGSGTTPTAANFANEVRQAEALKHGSFGAKVMYSYDGVETYGGWGAARVDTIDVDSYASFSFYINWDGSANDIKLGFEDSAGHVYFATVSNATLQLLGGYNKVTVNKSAFSEDIDNPGRTPGAIDWTDILKYSFTYTTQGTSSNYQYIDSISAGDVDWGGGTNGGGTGEVVITNVDPPAGPAGTKFTITGSGFGSSQGQSAVVFENLSTKVNYTVDIISWSDTQIEAYVPKLAPAGNYTLKVVRITISAGNVSAYESNPKTFQVTASLPPGGIATIFPNPFNPLATSLSASGFKVNEVTIAFSASGASNIGIYIYDATARLVYHETTTDTQVAWDGKDTQGNYVADGIYLLRIVNEDSKSLLAKNKILVIKK